MAFDWEHNLGHHKTYIGDQTLYAYFEDGFTVTFNSNGGRLKAEDPDVREIDTTDYEDNLFFDIGECIPVREGYKFEGWCTSPKFKGAKNIIISKNKRKSKTISKLKAKKKYYIRIRTYKKLKGNGKSYNIYSSWSKIKTKKVK